MTLTFVNDAAGGRGGGGARPDAGPGTDSGERRRPRGGGGGGRGGGLFSGSVASVTPTAEAVTLREHLSFVELPDNNYKPRYDDPRAGYGGLTYVDYSVPIGDIDADALHPPSSPREEGSERGDQRTGEADSVLGRSGRAGRRQEGAGRRRELVEPGVRSRRLPQRLQGRRCCPTAPIRWTSATT